MAEQDNTNMWTIKNISHNEKYEVYVEYESKEKFSYNARAYTLMPGNDLSEEDQEVKDYCSEIWTQQIIDSYVSDAVLPTEQEQLIVSQQ